MKSTSSIKVPFQSQKIIPFACMETSLRSLSCKNFAQGLAALDDLHQQHTQNGAADELADTYGDAVGDAGRQMGALEVGSGNMTAISMPMITALNSTGGREAATARPLMRMFRSL